MVKNSTLLFVCLFLALGLGAQVYIPVSYSQPPLLVANAGPDHAICHGDTAIIGGNPAGSGGTPAYSYFWSASTSITASNIPNPGAFPALGASYILTVTDGRGCSSSDTMVVSVDTCTGIHDAEFPFGITLFPNPSDGNFTIRFQGNGTALPATVTISNSIGQIVEKRELPPFSGSKDELFSLPFSRGNYLVEIVSGKKREIQKIVIR